ncbi:MAG TPA: hydroxyisourate hydrolase [Steroidobacteraceae bacterium]|nr:hydroxyisourate hydrolase [Steroidobacteraceae bacterium]
MGQLTTHVLDISAGVPAAGVYIELQERTAAGLRQLERATTGPDGRLAAPLLAAAAFRTGSFLLTFRIAAYFRARGVPLPDPAFLECASIEIGIAADQHYHVPLLIAPWSYSVYRGG